LQCNQAATAESVRKRCEAGIVIVQAAMTNRRRQVPPSSSNWKAWATGCQHPAIRQVRPTSLALKPGLRGGRRGAQHYAPNDVAGAQVI
jgi:hypothetical protein